MMRFCLLLLLLLPYLAGVGAGLVGRPEPAGPTAAHPYVHSAECQQYNYLRLDCFDTCNGDQTALQPQTKSADAASLLLTLPRIDPHCLPELPVLVASPERRAFPRYRPVSGAALPHGVYSNLYQPPRQC